MPRNFLVKRRAPTHGGAWPDDDVIASPLPVWSHESPDSGYCAHSPLRDESTGDATRDVTSGLPPPPPPPSLMTSSAAVLRTASSIYHQLMLRRRAETILAAAAKTGNSSLLPTGSASPLGTGIGSSAGLFPVCSLPLAPYLIPAALGNGATALNLSNKTVQPDDPESATTAHNASGEILDRTSSNIIHDDAVKTARVNR